MSRFHRERGSASTMLRTLLAGLRAQCLPGGPRRRGPAPTGSSRRTSRNPAGMRTTPRSSWTPPATRSRSGSGRTPSTRATACRSRPAPRAGPSPRPSISRRAAPRRSWRSLPAAKSSPPGNTSKTRRGSTRSRSRPGRPAPPPSARRSPPTPRRRRSCPRTCSSPSAPNGDIALSLERDRPELRNSTKSSAKSTRSSAPCTAVILPSSRRPCVPRAAASRPRNGSPSPAAAGRKGRPRNKKQNAKKRNRS